MMQLQGCLPQGHQSLLLPHYRCFFFSATSIALRILSIMLLKMWNFSFNSLLSDLTMSWIHLLHHPLYAETQCSLPFSFETIKVPLSWESSLWYENYRTCKCKKLWKSPSIVHDTELLSQVQASWHYLISYF